MLGTIADHYVQGGGMPTAGPLHVGTTTAQAVGDVTVTTHVDAQAGDIVFLTTAHRDGYAPMLGLTGTGIVGGSWTLISQGLSSAGAGEEVNAGFYYGILSGSSASVTVRPSGTSTSVAARSIRATMAVYHPDPLYTLTITTGFLQGENATPTFHNTGSGDYYNDSAQVTVPAGSTTLVCLWAGWAGSSGVRAIDCLAPLVDRSSPNTDWSMVAVGDIVEDAGLSPIYQIRAALQVFNSVVVALTYS